MLKNKRFLFSLLFSLYSINQIFASHLRAADIQLIQISGLTYKVTLSVYTDTDGVELNDAETVCIRPIDLFEPDTRLDCIEEIDFDTPNQGDSVALATEFFEITKTITFPDDGRYAISWNQDFRNANIVNITKESSANVSIYVETFIKIGGSTPQNSSPQLTAPPIDFAAVGEVFIHDPGAYDPDGDSLIFELLTPQAKNSNIPSDVPSYLYPGNETFGGASSFSIDPQTGIITWDTPQQEGTYVIAFSVTEYRNGIAIGSVIRDMQITVFDADNEPPVAEQIADICAIAEETTIIDTVSFYDPNGDPIITDHFGLPFERGATFNAQGVLVDSAYGVFNWNPGCEDVKEVDYLASFKVTDLDNFVPLSDSKSTKITVIGPAPKNLVANANGDNIVLNWDPYICNSSIAHIKIWRRKCSDEYFLDSCTAGVPSDWGFEQIGQVSPNVNTFTDNNSGVGLDEMINYNYVISADFKTPGRGESLPSNVAIAALDVISPIMTKVTADTTNLDDLHYTIAWQPPFILNLQGDVEVTVTRDEYLGPNVVDTKIITTLTGLESLDSSIIDSDVEFDTYYEYSVTYNSSIGDLESNKNSNIFPEAINTNGVLDLNWTYNTTWGGNDTLMTTIYRVNDDNERTILTQINSKLTTYRDEDVALGDTFCYIIETQGAFCHDSLTDITRNFSHKFCGVPSDTVPPCPPVAAILQNDCELFDTTAPIQNFISWLYPLSESCNDRIKNFKIYELIDGNAFPLDSLNPSDTSYLHANIDSYAKCYVVTATDSSGNESEWSNTVCNDNCELIEFPNLISPNNSDENNVFFNPFPNARFVEEIDFRVYNRWGSLIYKSVTDEEINWPGINLSGDKVTPGIYFYSAEVTFDKVNTADRTKILKGWIHIL